MSQLRKYAPFWEWPDRHIKELGIVQDFLNSMAQNGITLYRNPRAVMDDWPDCIVEDTSGNSVAVEVTELVDEEVVRRCQKGESVYRVWTDDEIVTEVNKRLLEKDLKCAHGKMYNKVILLIHTDEIELNSLRLFSVLSKAKFPRLKNIQQSFIMCSYEEDYPYLEIRLGK